MNTNLNMEKFEQQLDGLRDELKLISERQNSQYTDIMLQLKELKDEVHNEHTEPNDPRSDDELYAEAYKDVTTAGKASTSYI